MQANQDWTQCGGEPVRTTLLALVHSLSDGDRAPDDVVQSVRDSIDQGRVVLIGNFRDGLDALDDVAGDSSEARELCDAESETEARWAQGMAAAQAGDCEAYRRFFEELRPEIVRLVRPKLFDTSAVEDVVQNAMLAIHRSRHSFRPECRFGPWMRTIVRNTIVDHLRQIQRRNAREAEVDSIELLEDPRSRPVREANDRFDALEALLVQLPPAQRQAIVMTKLDGLSAAEAASRLGMSAGALRLRAHRGYRTLRALWKQRDEEPPRDRR